MTTTSQVVETASALRQIPLEQLEASRNNPRRTMNEADLKELAASIREHGVQVPLLVRPRALYFVENGSGFVRYVSFRNIIGKSNIQQTFNRGTGKENQAEAEAWAAEKNGPALYEIIAGHRRSQAATLAGLTEVPCIVRDMTDEQAAEIALIDNLQRVDVPALEEADAYANLQKRLGNATAIAARVGKDVSYVTRRLQLVSLGELPRNALAEQLMTIDHALLLARLGVAEQTANLKWLLNPNAGSKTAVETVIAERIKDRAAKRWSGYWEPQSVLDLKNHIEQNVGRKLSRAPWNLDDPTLLSDAGPCSGCPSNTKANTALFSDLDIDEATCENGGCFESKRAAFVQLRISEATKLQVGRVDGGPALRVSWKCTTTEPRKAKPSAGQIVVDDVSGFNLFQTFKEGQWIEAKPQSCGNIRAAVTVDWSDSGDRGRMSSGKKLRKPGEILSACIVPKCKVHRKAYEKVANSNNGRQDEAARKAEEEKRKAEGIEENKLRMAMAGAALEGVKTIPAEALRKMAAHSSPNYGDELKIANALLPGFRKTLQAAQVDGVEFAKACALVAIDGLAVEHWEEATNDRAKFIKSIRAIGYTGPDPWTKPAQVKKAAKPAAKKAPAKKAAAKKTAKPAKKAGR